MRIAATSAMGWSSMTWWPGGGDLDERGDPAEPVVHDVAHLRGHDAVLGPEQRHPAVQPGQRQPCRGPGAKTRGSHFQVHPPSTWRTDVAAT